MAQSDAEGRLEEALGLPALSELNWLSKSAVRAAVRNRQGAEELVATVQLASRSSHKPAVFSVASAQTTGRSYGVDVELRSPPGAAPADIIRYCGCMDHLKRGPICKHAGAVLLTLATEQREE
eukprot:15338690-Alexandrium_andersonii.AAC.1